MINEENLASFAYLIFIYRIEREKYAVCFQDLVYHYYTLYTQIYCIKRECETLHIRHILQKL